MVTHVDVVWQELIIVNVNDRYVVFIGNAVGVDIADLMTFCNI